MIDKKNKRVKIPICCGSDFGNFWCCRGLKRSENMSQWLGPGITIYFKTLKSFFLLFLVFTVISAPALTLFWNGQQSEYEQSNSKDYFSMMTLGNIGQSSRVCESRADIGSVHANPSDIYTVDMFCSFGQFSVLEAYYVSPPELTT